ncbi:hypothetical protein DPMN_123800 [Dreissena polymorpha]|uniref:Uncharacterized protein n=1 Tax=Dreissena polymorpha TaxID=45954 RepID=A0A9D4GR17_DREPO|nr:hypothetical protein DPMN_123800 [Dreissena polymorpha]
MHSKKSSLKSIGNKSHSFCRNKRARHKETTYNCHRSWLCDGLRFCGFSWAAGVEK